MWKRTWSWWIQLMELHPQHSTTPYSFHTMPFEYFEHIRLVRPVCIVGRSYRFSCTFHRNLAWFEPRISSLAECWVMAKELHPAIQQPWICTHHLPHVKMDTPLPLTSKHTTNSPATGMAEVGQLMQQDGLTFDEAREFPDFSLQDLRNESRLSRVSRVSR